MEATIEFEDRIIKCIDCGEEFVWNAGEQQFFRDKGLKNQPKRCKDCKHIKNNRVAALHGGVKQKIEVSVRCAQCGEQTTVPFYPSQGRPVYCRRCLHSKEGQIRC